MNYDYEKLMLRKIIYFIFVLMAIITIGNWNRIGNIDSETHSFLVIDLSVVLGMIIQDITDVWKELKRNK